MVLNIVLSGVGGQGILTLAQLIGRSALAHDVPVLIAETHGLSQRGGSVIVHVRLGRGVEAPLIGEGMGDMLVSLELVEAARYSPYLSKESIAIVNDKLIRPSVPNIKMPERDDVVEVLRQRSRELFLVKASEIANEKGNPIGGNVVMFGYVTYILGRAGAYAVEDAETEISGLGRGKIAEVNKELFKIGYEKASREVSDSVISLIKAKLE